jgi:uncharacterized glyoxalase superfamily protein PhnB
MKIVPCVTMYGLCKEAVDFYRQVFSIKKVEITTYGDAGGFNAPFVNDDNKELIFNGILYFDCGTVLAFKDSFTMLLDPMAEHSGSKDNIIIDIYDLKKEEIEKIYRAFMSRQSVANTKIGPTEDHVLYASLIDKYVICWNLYCDEAIIKE